MSQDRFVIQVKSQLGMAISRLRILQNNYTAKAKTECRGVANMIEGGKIERAKIRVENVIQLNLSTRFYELLERYCEILHARCMLMSLNPHRRQLLFSKSSAGPSSSKIAQTSLPEPAIAESICTILYVARDSGVKELDTIALLLQSRFSPEYIKAAFLDEDYVSPSDAASDSKDESSNLPPQVTSHCSPRVRKALEDMMKIPEPDLVSLYLREIADEYDLELDPKALYQDEDSEGDEGQLRNILVSKTKKESQIADLPSPPGTSKKEKAEDLIQNAKKEGNEDEEETEEDDGVSEYHPATATNDLPPDYDDLVDDGLVWKAKSKPEQKLNNATDENRTADTTLDGDGTTTGSIPQDGADMSEKEIQNAIDALTRDLAAFPSVPASPIHGEGEEDTDEPIDPEALLHSGIEAESVFKISDPENLFPSVPSDVIILVDKVVDQEEEISGKEEERRQEMEEDEDTHDDIQPTQEPTQEQEHQASTEDGGQEELKDMAPQPRSPSPVSASEPSSSEQPAASTTSTITSPSRIRAPVITRPIPKSTSASAARTPIHRSTTTRTGHVNSNNSDATAATPPTSSFRTTRTGSSAGGSTPSRLPGGTPTPRNTATTSTNTPSTGAISSRPNTSGTGSTSGSKHKNTSSTGSTARRPMSRPDGPGQESKVRPGTPSKPSVKRG